MTSPIHAYGEQAALDREDARLVAVLVESGEYADLDDSDEWTPAPDLDNVYRRTSDGSLWRHSLRVSPIGGATSAPSIAVLENKERMNGFLKRLTFTEVGEYEDRRREITEAAARNDVERKALAKARSKAKAALVAAPGKGRVRGSSTLGQVIELVDRLGAKLTAKDGRVLIHAPTSKSLAVVMPEDAGKLGDAAIRTQDTAAAGLAAHIDMILPLVVAHVEGTAKCEAGRCRRKPNHLAAGGAFVCDQHFRQPEPPAAAPTAAAEESNG